MSQYRQIIGDGMRAPHENPLERNMISLWVCGPSRIPNAPWAKDHVLEIAVGADTYLLPAQEVIDWLKGKMPATAP